ncbi:UNKNOWN [Stylonychia lemnae]|uniref:Uncharacterized protein n=1 Tax=Stylonychia lemnae TaxID=5949 RepID=A0A078AIP0_STYLE|nr:UNKNOWN [Stylonychia lemnae]|eukprot:CDW80678.1 UNKNOWN [Stylonychia lemnae]
MLKCYKSNWEDQQLTNFEGKLYYLMARKCDPWNWPQPKAGWRSGSVLGSQPRGRWIETTLRYLFY